jgi:ankyrin repeat protein
LIACCARADRPGAEALLQHTPELRSALQAEGATLLAEFSWNGNLDGVRCLLDLGVPVDDSYDEPDGYYQLGKRTTALHVAAWRSHSEVVRELLARGASADSRDDRGRTPLVLAVKACIDSYWMERRSPDSVAALLQAGASPSEIPLPTGYDPIDALLRNAQRA